MRKLILSLCGIAILVTGLTAIGCSSGPEPTKGQEGEAPKAGDTSKGGGTPPPVTEEKPMTK